MSELFDTIEMKAQDSAERERQAYEEQQQLQTKTRQLKRRRATKALVLRILAAVALCVAMSLAKRSGLMAEELIRGIYLVLAAWLSFWVGAWFQFMYFKGGLLQ